MSLQNYVGQKLTTSGENVDAPISRVLIVGVSGYVGTALALGLRDEFEVFGSYHSNPGRIDGVTCMPLNCVNGGEIFATIKKVKPDAILFCAGLTNPDLCQNNRALAESLNLKAPAMFFKVLPQPIQFLYFSSDNVFHDASPEAPPFLDGHPPNPVNYYAQTKAQAEAMLMSHQRLTHVFRLATLYGEPMGFPTHPRSTWVDWLRSRAARKQSLPLYSDQIRSHLYVGDLARAVKAFLKKAPQESKLYNIAGTSTLSRLEFGQQLCEALDIDTSLIKPTQSETDRTHVARPLNAGLSSKRFEADFDFRFQSAEDGIHEMAERLRTGFTRGWA